MEISDLKNEVKNTVGYAEAVNKESFIVGSNVAFAKCEKFYEERIKTLTEQMNFYKKSYEQVNTDMKIVARIFNKYNI